MEDDIITGEVQGDENAPGPNPAWDSVLSILPEQFHSVVTPRFQEWDTAANSKIESLNSQVKAFEEYSAFAEHKIPREELEQGLRLMYEINNNPQEIWEALGKAFNLQGESSGAAPGASDDEIEDTTQQNYQDPRVAQLEQGMELVSRIVLNEQQAKQAQIEDSALEREMAKLTEKYGEFDERYVLGLMANDTDAETAVKAFVELKNSLLQSNPRPFAPSVMGSSGGGSGIPSQAIDPTKLSGKDTRNLVAQMLAAAANQK